MQGRTGRAHAAALQQPLQLGADLIRAKILLSAASGMRW
jgi:hypothetical protein